MTTEAKSVKIPIWFASILAAAILAFAVDTWRTVNKLDIGLRCLRTELAAKGLIDPKLAISSSPKTANLSPSGDCFRYQTNHTNQLPSGMTD